MSELTPALLWLIPVAPLIASVFIAFFGKALLRGRSHVPCVAALAVSTICAGMLMLTFLASPTTLQQDTSLLTKHQVEQLQAVTADHGHQPILTTPGYDWAITEHLHVRMTCKSTR